MSRDAVKFNHVALYRVVSLQIVLLAVVAAASAGYVGGYGGGHGGHAVSISHSPL